MCKAKPTKKLRKKKIRCKLLCNCKCHQINFRKNKTIRVHEEKINKRITHLTINIHDWGTQKDFLTKKGLQKIIFNLTTFIALQI
jgi:hypothetical protein